MALALLLVLLPIGCSRDRSVQPPPLAASSPAAGGLQEVAPPAGVQQLAPALADHSPQVRILAPVDGATLPDGPWSVRLQVRDWPLAEAGALGLGAHVVVQLDDEPPQRVGPSSAGPSGEYSLPMPPLRPGSHRLTAFAARPWGEAVKSPGAYGQIQVQRVAPTPLRVPAPGTPQLIAVSPGTEPQAEPVLLDWLLLDAPLQGLREGDASWRLRVSVNGDSFLVDQNSPLWLRGWRSGSNTLQLELVDGRGEPLNPPFNSLLSEVVIQPGAPRPAWLSRLEPAALARLLGQSPPEPEIKAEVEVEAEIATKTETKPEPEPQLQPQPGTHESPVQPDAAAAAPPSEVGALAEGEPPTLAPVEPTPHPPSEPALTPAPRSDPPAVPETLPASVLRSEPPLATQEPDTDSETPSPVRDEPTQAARLQASEPVAPAPRGTPERIAPGTSRSGSARTQVREDGSLIRPRGRSPLAGLRERFSS